MRPLRTIALALSLALPDVHAQEVPELYREWAQVLEKHVVPVEGWGTGVKYTTLRGDRTLLDAFLGKLEATDPATMTSEKEKLAYWINAYNAFAIQALLDHDPVESIRDLGTYIPPQEVWKKEWYKAAGKSISLDTIEHKILRPDFKDFRVHAAIVCASRSCPDLQPLPYLPATLDAQLDESLTKFLASSKGLQLDAPAGKLKISSIFKWFEEDFTAGGKTLLEALDPFLPATVKDHVKGGGKLEIEYLDYDWQVNKAD